MKREERREGGGGREGERESEMWEGRERMQRGSEEEEKNRKRWSARQLSQ